MSDDCKIPEFYSYHEPVARKEHECCECDAPIRKGEKYFHVSMKFDDHVFSERQHLTCMYACMEVRDFDGECIDYGGLKEWVEVSRGDYRRDDHLVNFWKLYAKILRRERRARHLAKKVSQRIEYPLSREEN